ncbi:MAG: hypothetical protein GXP47_12315 [Acidobacteria bacterium]|nr:hypothetical protein [Acidobacteriota bacterium]
MPDDCGLVVAGSDGRRLEARMRRVGDDLVVVVEGGMAHVGCVVVAVGRDSTARPGERSVSTSVLTLPPHKEEPVARTVAEALARRFGGTVVVTAGIHEEGLDAAGIEAWLRLGRELAGHLEEALGRRGEAGAAAPAGQDRQAVEPGPGKP